MDAPAVAVSSDGKTLTIAWMDMRAGKNDRSVFWTTSSGGAFAAETSVTESLNDIQSHPSACVDSKGIVHAVFEDQRGGKKIGYRNSQKGSKDTIVADGEYPVLACGKVIGFVFEGGNRVLFQSIK